MTINEMNEESLAQDEDTPKSRFNRHLDNQLAPGGEEAVSVPEGKVQTAEMSYLGRYDFKNQTVIQVRPGDVPLCYYAPGRVKVHLTITDRFPNDLSVSYYVATPASIAWLEKAKELLAAYVADARSKGDDSPFINPAWYMQAAKWLLE